MKITKLAAIGTAALGFAALEVVPALLVFPAVASAGVGPTFKSPSGNIACWVADDMAGCQVLDHLYPSWPGGCSSPDIANFMLVQGKPVRLDCDGRPADPPATWTATSLDYGKSYSIGVMNCESAELGITCTDSSTGHFFQASHDGYQVG